MTRQQPLDAFGEGQSDDGEDFTGADGVFRWVPDGEQCARCGHDSTRLWRDGIREVCPDCKEW